MNPNAIVLWLFCSGCGYLIGGDLRSTVEGLMVGFAISIIGSFASSAPRR